jgi:type III secretion protein Q
LALEVPVAVEGRLLDSAFAPQRAVARGAAYVLLDFAAMGAAAVLELELPFVSQVLSHLSGTPAAESPVEELTRVEGAALGYLALVALKAARLSATLEGVAPRLQGVVQSKQEAVLHLEDERHAIMELSIKVGERAGHGRLIFAGSALQALAEARPREPLGAVEPEVRAARTWVQLFLEAGQLTSVELDGLSEGDVVALPGVELSQGQVRGRARVRLLGSELQGELSKDGFHGTVVICPHPPEPNMTESKTIQEAALLPVDVEVELARVQLPLGELTCLQSGMVLPLRMNASDPVLVRVGDRAVARAELVDLEGEVGARILSLLP